MKSEVAHTLKSLTSKLHGPLPVTPQASQQLLSQLNASFKEQFDRQHSATSPSIEDHANLHLQSILKNPLFNAKPRTYKTSTTKAQNIGQPLGHLDNHTTQALDAFRERASQGTADLNMAKSCLSIQYNACMTSCDATPRQAMQTSGAGSTIVQWLWSSGMEDTGTFLADRHFLAMLVAFLLAEGQQSRISHWIQRCRLTGERPFSSVSVSCASGIAAQLFTVLIRQEIHVGNGLESAIDLFLRTVADLRSVGFEGSFMMITSRFAAWEVIINISRLPDSSEPQPPIFHAFSETVRSMTPNHFLDACLSVYTQERPDPQPTLMWFQNSKDLHKTKRANQRPYIVLLGLRAAELFLEDGRQMEAVWIMEFLRTNFKPELGSPESQKCRVTLRPRSRHATANPSGYLKVEERNLQLLNTLTVHY